MVNYEKMYMVLFNGITDALRDMQQQNYGFAMFTLVESQKRAEYIYIDTAENELPA
jgi:hypothetical protein